MVIIFYRLTGCGFMFALSLIPSRSRDDTFEAEMKTFLIREDCTPCHFCQINKRFLSKGSLLYPQSQLVFVHNMRIIIVFDV